MRGTLQKYDSSHQVIAQSVTLQWIIFLLNQVKYFDAFSVHDLTFPNNIIFMLFSFQNRSLNEPGLLISDEEV